MGNIFLYTGEEKYRINSKIQATQDAMRVENEVRKTKAEAEAARSKLTALGVETVLLPPKSAKR